MSINEIQKQYNDLNYQLQMALSTMEKKDTIKIIRNEIKNLQNICPHKLNDSYDFTEAIECPYCGKKLKG